MEGRHPGRTNDGKEAPRTSKLACLSPPATEKQLRGELRFPQVKKAGKRAKPRLLGVRSSRRSIQTLGAPLRRHAATRPLELELAAYLQSRCMRVTVAAQFFTVASSQPLTFTFLHWLFKMARPSAHFFVPWATHMAAGS